MIYQPLTAEGYKLLFSREGRKALKAFAHMDAPLHHKAALAVVAAVNTVAMSGKVIN